MSKFVVSIATPLLPDPDESSQPLMQLGIGDRVTRIRILDIWSKVSFADAAGTVHPGWVLSRHIEAAPATTIRLFPQPFSDKPEEIAGEISAILGELAGAPWKFVRVLREDGSVVEGWIDASQGADLADAKDEKDDAPLAPGKVDLALGVNERYGPHLLKAQELTKIDAAALAALVNAEAAKISSGPDKGLWNARSYNEDSHAAGLTQFLKSTWIAFARKAATSMKRPTTLNRIARERGLITAQNTVAPGMEEALLALRFDPELSIVSAAELGVENISALRKAGDIDEDLADDDLAQIYYLAHHEGLEGARRILTRTNSQTLKQLAKQVGRVKAEQLVLAANGDSAKAYRDWLNGYIRERIQPQKFRRTSGEPLTAANPATTSSLASFDGDAIPIALLPTFNRVLAQAVQQKLIDHGYLDPPADGSFGPVSNWALSEFYARNGLDLAGGFTKTVAQQLIAPKKPLPSFKPSGVWFDPVVAHMLEKGYFVSRHPDCKNIVYLEGVETDGQLNDNAPNKFNDVRIVFSLTESGAVSLNIWDATTEPGRRWTFMPMNANGAARIAFGQYKSWSVGVHKRGTRSAHEALVQVKPVKVFRDLDKNFKREGDRAYEGLFGINQHWGYNNRRDDLGSSSAGCLVGREVQGHRDFMILVKSDPRYISNGGYRFVTTILPAAEALGRAPIA